MTLRRRVSISFKTSPWRSASRVADDLSLGNVEVIEERGK